MRACAIGLLLGLSLGACGRTRYVASPLDSGADAATSDDAASPMDAVSSIDATIALDARPSDAPTLDAPAEDAPARDASSSDALSLDAPSADAPSFDAPSADAPSLDASRELDAGPSIPIEVLRTTGVALRGLDALADGTPVIAGAVDGAFSVGATSGSTLVPSGIVAIGERLLDTFTLTSSGAFTDGPMVSVSGDLVLVTGTTRDPLTSACGTLPIGGSSDGFVIVYRASDGACVWQRVSGGAGAEQVAHAAGWAAGSAILVASHGAGAFAAATPTNAVVSFRASDGAVLPGSTLSFTPSGLAVAGDTLYVVGDAEVRALDLRAPSALPLWSRTLTLPGATFSLLRSVTVEGSELAIGGNVRWPTLVPVGAGGSDDGWTILLGTDGTDRWDELVGGTGYDYAWSAVADGTRVASALSVTGDVIAGLSSRGPAGYQPLFVERDRASGAVLRFHRLTETIGAGVVARPGRPLLYATTVAVYEWP